MALPNSETWVPIPYTPGDPQPRIAEGVYRGIRSDGKGGFEGIVGSIVFGPNHFVPYKPPTQEELMELLDIAMPSLLEPLPTTSKEMKAEIAGLRKEITLVKLFKLNEEVMAENVALRLALGLNPDA